jgi:hypothetical protein
VSDKDFDFEHMPGIPAPLPEGEKLLWQGSPETVGVARQVMHIRIVAIYFALLAAWRIATSAYDGYSAGETLIGLVPILVAAGVTMGILWLLAYLIARTTIYTITSQRLLMRFGVALPITVNLPFKAIRSADIVTRADGSGDIAITTHAQRQLGYVHLWPHARPWHLREPKPMLRALPDIAGTAAILARALKQAAGQPVTGAAQAVSQPRPDRTVPSHDSSIATA